MIKIMLFGKYGSGKNLFLSLAKTKFPEEKFQERKFAEPIYKLADLLYEHLRYEFLSREVPTTGKDGKLLQFLGSHFKEVLGEDLWSKMFFDVSCTSNHIITDGRFPLEFGLAKGKGYTTVRIHRQYELRLNNKGNRDDNHISETAMDGVPDSAFDYTINNNGSLGLFEGAVCKIITDVKNLTLKNKSDIINKLKRPPPRG